MERYSRQELLLGKKAQDKLNKSTVAIVGIGALGTTAANLLARAGVNLALFDIDVIELSNLQRQTIFTEEDVGKSKALQAATYLKRVNSTVQIEAYNVFVDFKNVHNLKKYNVILDCTDSMEARFCINDFCVENKKVWIMCSVVQSLGRIKVFLPGKACLRCIYAPQVILEQCGKCNSLGILNTVCSVMAAMQVNECIKILTKQKPCEELIAYDIMKQSFEKIYTKKRKQCICH